MWHISVNTSRTQPWNCSTPLSLRWLKLAAPNKFTKPQYWCYQNEWPRSSSALQPCALSLQASSVWHTNLQSSCHQHFLFGSPEYQSQTSGIYKLKKPTLSLPYFDLPLISISSLFCMFISLMTFLRNKENIRLLRCIKLYNFWK